MLVVFWNFCVMGLLTTEVLILITEKRINKFYDENCQEEEDICFEQLDKKTQVLLCMRTVIWNAIVVGIAISQFSGMFYDESFLARMAISLLPVMVLYILGLIRLQIRLCDDKKIHMLLVIIFILSIAIWTTLITKYYQRNVEEVTEKEIEQVKKRELVDICGIPVTGETTRKGGRQTNIGDELSYKYIDEYGQIQDAVVPADYISSKPKKWAELAYVEIISYHYYKRYTDYYVGESWLSSERRWKEYIFYLPDNLSIEIK